MFDELDQKREETLEEDDGPLLVQGEESDWEDVEGEELEREDDNEGAQVEGWEEWSEASLDSEDESDIEQQQKTDPIESKPLKKTNIAMEKILTEKDFKKLNALKIHRAANKKTGNKQAEPLDYDSQDSTDEEEDTGPTDVVDVYRITSGVKRKRDYESRMESIKSGREGREKFGSRKNSEERSSKTNREKSKMKLNTMMVHKRAVKGKARRSLNEKQKTMRNHIDKMKIKK